MPAADTSDSGRPLYAEPAQAHTLIAQGAEVAAKAGADAPANAASSVPGTVSSSPFDAAVAAAQAALPQQDSAAAVAAAGSSATHAGGSEAAVTSVTATDTEHARDLAKVGSQIPASQIYTI